MKKKLITIFSLGAIVGGMYYFMQSGPSPETTSETTSEKIAATNIPMEQLAANDSASSLPDDIRESIDNNDQAATIEDTDWFDNQFRRVKHMSVDDQAAEEEQSDAFQESLDVPPHKKEYHWLKQVLASDDDEEVIIEESESDGNGVQSNTLKEAADTVSPEITD